MKSKYEMLVKDYLEKANVKCNSNEPISINVFNDQFYKKTFLKGSFGFGESYVDGWWESPELNSVVFNLARFRLVSPTKNSIAETKINLSTSLYWLMHKIFNYQTIKKSFEVIEKHYHLGNDLFQNMLDSTMAYTCGYWKNANNLEEAQINKLDLICKKLGLKKGMTLLDIGCGWGGFAEFAAKNYGVNVTGITISTEQKKMAEERCKHLPVKILLQDYRTLNQKFDRICAVGMMEHVGYKNYRTFMKVAHRCLNPDGLFLIQVIGSNVSNTHTDEWIDKYLYPNALSPSIKQIGAAIEDLFIMEDWHNFGHFYEKTLLAWYDNFQKSWESIKANYSERFYRIWKFYLLGAAGLSRARDGQLWQIVLSKNGVVGGYDSYR